MIHIGLSIRISFWMKRDKINPEEVRGWGKSIFDD
jgi:hypothetical protein